MMKYTLKNENIESYNDSDTFRFPKYTSQLINWANQNAQGTRPVVVGQMSELFPEFTAKKSLLRTGATGMLKDIPMLLLKQRIRFMHRCRISVMLFRLLIVKWLNIG